MFYFGVEFYETTTYTEFVHLVKCKMGLPEESKVVEEGVSCNEVDDRGKASIPNLSSGKRSNTPIGNFKSPSKSQYHSVAENENVLPEPIMYVTPENYKYIGDNDVGTYVNDVGVNHNLDQKKALDVVDKVGNESGKEEVSFLDDGELKGYVEFADCDKLDIAGLESDSNEEELDGEPKLIYSNTMFHGMPPLPSCPVNDNVNIPCQRLDINEKIKVLDIFDDKELLKLAIGTQCMEQGKQYKTTRSSKERFEVVCLV
ncbi:unnamed protein product [Lactuca saligna]|uniref:Uncharacterized protein n=1 Tax=Lactuca saligna TaxID=75948 RepID=A0AA36E5B5_LACSI|nr:unnamed protein product [Lactuca saligna]